MRAAILSGDCMENHLKNSVEFDYTSFLGATCRKQWTFLEALTTITPVFATLWTESVKEQSLPEDRLWEAALKSMSSRRSDESNLVTLLELAKLEGIEELKVVMPYSLEPDQIAYIQKQSEMVIERTTDEEFCIQLQ